MKKIKESAIYISSPSNLFYLSKIKNEDARIIIFNKNKYYLTDNRNIQTVENLLKGYTIINIGKDKLQNSAIKLLQDLSVSSLAIEGNHLSYNEIKLILSKIEKINIEDNITNLINSRKIKSEFEIESIKESQTITDTVYGLIIKEIKDGITEKELASFINYNIYKMGAELAFDTIVAFGENSACPHAIPSDNNKLKIRDSVLIDFGAKLNNYCSDMTRSFSYKKADPLYIEAFKHVLKAQSLAITQIQAGIKCSKVNDMVIDYYKGYNLDEFFTHSLGHGLGIDIHESPYISSNSNEYFQNNMIVTVEPGLYFPNNFGIRLEDLILLSENTAHNLTKSPKNMIIE